MKSFYKCLIFCLLVFAFVLIYLNNMKLKVVEGFGPDLDNGGIPDNIETIIIYKDENNESKFPYPHILLDTIDSRKPINLTKTHFDRMTGEEDIWNLNGTEYSVDTSVGYYYTTESIPCETEPSWKTWYCDSSLKYILFSALSEDEDDNQLFLKKIPSTDRDYLFTLTYTQNEESTEEYTGRFSLTPYRYMEQNFRLEARLCQGPWNSDVARLSGCDTQVLMKWPSNYEHNVKLIPPGENIVNKINNPDSSNKGCENYLCKNNPRSYDNYELKLSVNDDNNDFHNCTNITDETYLINNPDVIPCSNEICCDNHVCKTNRSSIQCNSDQLFMPNKKCTYSPDSVDADTCNTSRCCQTIDHQVESEMGYENCNNLFDCIINFRNDKGGNISNGNNITGEDIRNYIYYSLLDLVEIDVHNNPLYNRVDRICSDDDDCTNARPKFKSSGQYADRSTGRTMQQGTVIKDDCFDTGSRFFSTYKFPDYPAIGNKIAYDVEIVQEGTNCPNPGLHTVGQYPWLNDKETLNYNDYDLLSKWITGLNVDSDYDYLKLINSLETQDTINIVNSDITKINLKKMIINLTKEIDINNTSAKTTPLDRFFHTSINNYSNSLIDKNIFLGLLNQ